MKKYLTEIRAVSSKDGELHTYAGPEVPGISFKDAEDYCQRNGLGYCKVIGEYIADVCAVTGKIIDYESIRLN